MTRTEIILVLLIVSMGLLPFVYGQDPDRDKRCAMMANWAVELLAEHRAGIIVNVMPSDQAFFDMVKAHQGTPDELRKEILGKCSGVRV